jgi:hypothetical protein
VPDPGAVRPEYEALARDFRVLAGPFDVAVDDAVERDLVLVAASFEAIDRHVDATTDAAERGRLCAAVASVLRGANTDNRIGGELFAILASIRARLVALGALEAFVTQLERFFVRSERLRRTSKGSEFVRCVLDEAKCAAEMTLLVIPVPRASRFARFFRVLSEVANLVDKLHDVRGDWARGEMAVRPGPVLHIRLIAAFASRLPALLFLAGSPLQLIVWGVRYVLPPRAGDGWATRESRIAKRALANRQENT